VGAFNLKLKKPWKNGGFAGFYLQRGIVFEKQNLFLENNKCKKGWTRVTAWT